MEQPYLTGKRHVFSLFKIQIKSKDNVSYGHAIKSYRELEAHSHKVRTSTLAVDEWLASTNGLCISGRHLV